MLIFLGAILFLVYEFLSIRKEQFAQLYRVNIHCFALYLVYVNYEECWRKDTALSDSGRHFGPFSVSLSSSHYFHRVLWCCLGLGFSHYSLSVFMACPYRLCQMLFFPELRKSVTDLFLNDMSQRHGYYEKPQNGCGSRLKIKINPLYTRTDRFVMGNEDSQCKGRSTFMPHGSWVAATSLGIRLAFFPFFYLLWFLWKQTFLYLYFEYWWITS